MEKRQRHAVAAVVGISVALQAHLHTALGGQPVLPAEPRLVASEVDQCSLRADGLVAFATRAIPQRDRVLQDTAIGQRHEALVAALAPLDPKARLPWYGPDMSARSFATARLMETWAHGQDIWDALGRTRGASPGLRHILHLGVGTYGWTFVNRGLPVPQPAPHVDVVAPDGSHWTWGDPSATDWVTGPAMDLALLVTQRRHRDDTALRWAGEGAEQWTLIAQCFAGPPADGPARGVRGGSR